MKQTTSRIADKVRGVAAEKRFTQQRIAETLGLARSSVAERIAGRVSFTGEELFDLSIAMGVPVSRFYPETTPPPTASIAAASAPAGAAAPRVVSLTRGGGEA